MKPRRRHARREAAEEREWIHVDSDRAICVSALEGDAHETIGPLLESVLRERWTQHITKERLTPFDVERSSVRCRVQRKPIERRAERLVEAEPARRERGEATQPLWSGRRDLTRDRGRFERCFPIVVSVARLECEHASLLEISPHAPNRALEHLTHLARAKVAKHMPLELAIFLAVGSIEED